MARRYPQIRAARRMGAGVLGKPPARDVDGAPIRSSRGGRRRFESGLNGEWSGWNLWGLGRTGTFVFACGAMAAEAVSRYSRDAHISDAAGDLLFWVSSRGYAIRPGFHAGVAGCRVIIMGRRI